MSNIYKRILALFPSTPLQVGDVTAWSDGIATITLPGGGQSQARGSASVGDRVYFSGGVIEGPAPDLPVVLIEV